MIDEATTYASVFGSAIDFPHDSQTLGLAVESQSL